MGALSQGEGEGGWDGKLWERGPGKGGNIWDINKSCFKRSWLEILLSPDLYAKRERPMRWASVILWSTPLEGSMKEAVGGGGRKSNPS